MSHEAVNAWVQKAKLSEAAATDAPQEGVRVIRSSDMANRGNLIMQIAEKLRPWIMKMFEGVRDENGMAVQPARVRAIALNVAQRIVKEQSR